MMNSFTLDPCSIMRTINVINITLKEDDGLSKDWVGETVFCNPPYGNQ